MFFKRPHEGMKIHLKPLFISAKVDRGETINLMPDFLLGKIGKFDTDLRLYNTVLSNYEGKIIQTMRVIQVDITT